MKKIMIFIEGTTFYTKPVLFLFSKKGYVPIGKSIEIINELYDKGNEIYLCSYVRKNRYTFIKSVMDYYKIKYTKILCREKEEQYKDLVESILPDILIEDDCKSIGGEKEWCITNVKEEMKQNIKSIIVEEFSGIDNIENNIL
jgi:hypothetical protein